MKRIKGILILIIPLFMLFASSNYCIAEDLVWYEEKNEAFEIAKEEGKFVILFVGIIDCPYCNGIKKLLNEAPLRQLVDENYILWFSDRTIAASRTEVKIYTDLFDKQAQIESMTLPFMYVINPDEPGKYLASEWGYDEVKSPEIMKLFLEVYTLSNDFTGLPEQKVFISDFTLNIYNDISDEYIYIYSPDGKLIHSFYKKDKRSSFETYRLPKGILIINSSKKWSYKVVNR